VPANTYGTVPGNASLVIIYRVLSNQPSLYQLKATVIYDGSWSLEYAAGNPSYFNETISGFYDARRIEAWPPAEFWDRYDKAEFKE